MPVAVLRDWLKVWRFSVFGFPNALRGNDMEEPCFDLLLELPFTEVGESGILEERLESVEDAVMPDGSKSFP
jgi:hypothetical protein